MRRDYTLRDVEAHRVDALRRATRLSPLVARVLALRGIEDVDAAKRYLEPTLASLGKPDAMADRGAAIDRLARAIRARERVVVFGDYDVDGMTSATILTDVLERLGADVSACVAHRFDGGYGLSERALERCLARSPSLLVTCDCGSSDHDRVADARARGVDVIVVDHHLVPERALPAVAFLNPHRPDCGFPTKGMCSAGLAFVLAAGLRAALDATLDVRPWLDLVALGTIADVAPLVGDNRTLVRAGLDRIAKGLARPGVAALLERAGVRPGTRLSSMDVAFKLAPRVNAPGRLGDPSVALALLRAKSLEEARPLAEALERANEARRETERRVTEAAIAETIRVYGEVPRHGVVVAGEGWHRGVVGITAARLVERFAVPAIVIALEDGVGHGSGRTIEGVDVHGALAEARSCLAKFGGHRAAIGLTVDAASVETVRAVFAEATAGATRGEAPMIVDALLDADDPLPPASELERLEPLGEGNPSPRIAARGRVLDVRVVGEGHLSLKLGRASGTLRAFAPRLAALAPTLGEELVLLGVPRPDTYSGGEAIELYVEAFGTS